MARPSEPKKRRELARRAVAVLQKEGLDVPMARLADALEIKRPTLHYHFANRAEIIECALEDLLTEQAMFVLAKIAPLTHPIDRVYAQVRAVHEFHHGREARVVFLSQAIATSAAARMESIIEVGNRVFEPYRRAQADAIKKGIEDGLVAPCDADALMATVRALIDGLMVQRVMTGLDLAPAHEFLWDHVLKPLRRET
jgi:AcrR family transcriptional regulator